jgi:uncharacterized protein YjcR
MPRNTLSVVPDSLDSDDSMKALAFELFCSSSKTSYATLAKRVGVSRETFIHWAQEDGWLSRRALLREKQRSDLIKQAGDPEQAQIQIIKAAKALIAMVEQKLANAQGEALSADLVDQLTKTLKTQQDIIARGYGQLGLAE